MKKNITKGYHKIIYYIFLYLAVFAGLGGTALTIGTQIAMAKNSVINSDDDKEKLENEYSFFIYLFGLSAYICIGSLFCLVIAELLRKHVLVNDI